MRYDPIVTKANYPEGLRAVRSYCSFGMFDAKEQRILEDAIGVAYEDGISIQEWGESALLIYRADF